MMMDQIFSFSAAPLFSLFICWPKNKFAAIVVSYHACFAVSCHACFAASCKASFAMWILIFCRQWPCLFRDVDSDFCNLTVCCSFNVIWQGQKIAQKFFHIFCPLQFLGTNWRTLAQQKNQIKTFLNYNLLV